MENIGEYRGYQIYWSNPFGDGGTGTGEVMAGDDSVGHANSEDEAMEMAEHFIDDYEGKTNNMG